ncbi:MAG TPA: hypothetical protein PLJ26_01670 [Candidatus Omnitrophota bacterium]|nr:hypothetical protein [Candidatus Omnitrophota bacterium]HQJ15179.1 hypothetical protein [Candidatus Omnitrophota bacterium]
MNAFMMPYGLMIILILFPLVIVYALCLAKRSCPETRRRWARIKVPADKRMTCRIIEPDALASNLDYFIDDINMSGIAFFSSKALPKKTVRLLIRFPFADYGEAASVLGRIAYSREIGRDKYRIGIEYQRER